MILKNTHSLAWAKTCLKTMGYDPQSPFTLVRNMPWSSVYKVLTSIGTIYFKQMPPSFAIEATLINTLSTKFPTQVPKIIGYNAELHCFLMTDAGIVLHDLLHADYNMILASLALSTYAIIQKGVINDIDTLLSLDVPDWRLDTLPSLYLTLLDDEAFLISDGLTKTEIQQLRKLHPKVVQLCKQLAQYNIPETIEHSDFHDNNILVGKNHTLVINDWGETVITHPFFSLISFFISAARRHHIFEDSEPYKALRDGYLNNWLEFESSGRLLEAFKLTKQLGHIKYALSFYRITQLPGWNELGQNKGRIAHTLKAFIQELG